MCVRLPALPPPQNYDNVITGENLLLQGRLQSMKSRVNPPSVLTIGTPVSVQKCNHKGMEKKSGGNGSEKAQSILLAGG